MRILCNSQYLLYFRCPFKLYVTRHLTTSIQAKISDVLHLQQFIGECLNATDNHKRRTNQTQKFNQNTNEAYIHAQNLVMRTSQYNNGCPESNVPLLNTT